MAILDHEFLHNSSGFHAVQEELLEQKTAAYLECPESSIPQEIFDYVSPLRHLLLEWYPFYEDSRILEVGGNLGELTEILCKNGKSVVTVEPSPARADIIRRRCSGYGNIEVKSTDFKEISSLGKFDYIIIHNYFGFLRKYFSAENAYVSFLKLLHENLTSRGKILVAANNRLGAKYMAGAIEEHTKKMYTGIQMFDGYDKVRTFSKAEFIEMFQDAGIKAYKFYYPFPSYVFPTEIHTAESLKYFDYGDEDFATDYESAEFFDKKKWIRSIQREGCMETFTNSFLIELAKDTVSNVLYYKPNLKEYQHKTGYRICGMDMKNASLHDFSLEKDLSEENSISYDRNAFYFEAEKVKICIGNGGEFSFHARFKETLFTIIEYHVRNGRTKALCEIICEYWKRICDALRKFKDKEIGIADLSIERVYLLDSEMLCLLLPPSTCSPTAADWEYLIWKLIYTWYTSQILCFKSFKKSIPLKNIYGSCGIDLEAANVFREKFLSQNETKSDELELRKHSCMKFEMGLLESADILAQGTPVLREGCPYAEFNDRQKTLLYEKKLLNNLRR